MGMNGARRQREIRRSPLAVHQPEQHILRAGNEYEELVLVLASSAHRLEPRPGEDGDQGRILSLGLGGMLAYLVLGEGRWFNGRHTKDDDQVDSRWHDDSCAQQRHRSSDCRGKEALALLMLVCDRPDKESSTHWRTTRVWLIVVLTSIRMITMLTSLPCALRANGRPCSGPCWRPSLRSSWASRDIRTQAIWPCRGCPSAHPPSHPASSPRATHAPAHPRTHVSAHVHATHPSSHARHVSTREPAKVATTTHAPHHRVHSHATHHARAACELEHPRVERSECLWVERGVAGRRIAHRTCTRNHGIATARSHVGTTAAHTRGESPAGLAAESTSGLGELSAVFVEMVTLIARLS